MINIYKPKYDELIFREKLLNDKDTMAYNDAWGGVISFPKEKWQDWYDYWIINTDGLRYYAYVINENNEFIGEIAYHYNNDYESYIANVIIHSRYRKRGYGSEALKMLCEIAKENGIKELFDDIAIDNPGITIF